MRERICRVSNFFIVSVLVLFLALAPGCASRYSKGKLVSFDIGYSQGITKEMAVDIIEKLKGKTRFADQCKVGERRVRKTGYRTKVTGYRKSKQVPYTYYTTEPIYTTCYAELRHMKIKKAECWLDKGMYTVVAYHKKNIGSYDIVMSTRSKRNAELAMAALSSLMKQ